MGIQVELKNVNKYYGKKQALNDVTLTISEGMFGLLGKNGAGKTTMMKALSTLLPIDAGSINVCGVDIKEASKVRALIGYLPQDFSMYKNMSVYEAMDYLGVLSGMKKQERKERIPMLLNKVNLQKNYQTKVKAMSGGMRRRLGIAQALLHDPKVVIVDEPTAGLDPEERIRFRNLLCEVAEDRIVLLSTHIVGDIEATCENIAVLNEGSLIFQGTVMALLKQCEGKVFTAEVSKVELPTLKKQLAITSVLTKASTAEIRFIAQEKPFASAQLAEANVEDAYMYLMKTVGGDDTCLSV